MGTLTERRAQLEQQLSALQQRLELVQREYWLVQGALLELQRIERTEATTNHGAAQPD